MSLFAAILRTRIRRPTCQMVPTQMTAQFVLAASAVAALGAVVDFVVVVVVVRRVLRGVVVVGVGIVLGVAVWTTVIAAAVVVRRT